MERSIATAGLLAGWLLARLALEAGPAAGPRAVDERGEEEAAAADDLCATELRTLPGLGPARALQIARARWEIGLRGGPESWERLHGIGPATVAAIRGALEAARGARVEGSSRPAYTDRLPP